MIQVELDEMLGEAWMKHFEKKTKAKKAKVPGKKNLDELLKAKNKEGKVFGTVGIAQVSVLLCTVTFYANRAHSLTRSP